MCLKHWNAWVSPYRRLRLIESKCGAPSLLGLHRAALRTLGIALVTTLLAACTTVPELGTQPTPLLPPDTVGWTARGKASIAHPGSAQTVNLRWSRLSPGEDLVRVSGPLGARAAEIVRQGSELFLRNNRQLQPLDSVPGDSPLRAVVDNLPLAQISLWLMGYTATGNLWQVEIDEWQTADGWQVPERLTARSTDITVKVVLLEWTLGRENDS